MEIFVPVLDINILNIQSQNRYTFWRNDRRIFYPAKLSKRHSIREGNMKTQDACFKSLLFFNMKHFLTFLYSVFTSYARCVGTLMLLQYVQHHQFISCCIVHHQERLDFGHHNLHVFERYLLHFEAVEVFVIWCHLCPHGVSVQKVCCHFFLVHIVKSVLNLCPV